MTGRQFCSALTESLKWKGDVGCNLFVPSQMFPNQIYHERLKSSPRVKTEYGLRVENVLLGPGLTSELIAITVERPNGITDWPLRLSKSEHEAIAGRFSTIIYDNPETIPEKIKRRVADLFEFTREGRLY